MQKILETFFTGLNYWGSEQSINMWENFDIKSIEEDVKVISSAGITHLRVFPLWSYFQPLTPIYGPSSVYEYAFGEDPLPDTESGRAGVSDYAVKKFELFCELAEKYGFKLIVSLINGHMSFRTYAPKAFWGKALLSDPTVMKWQSRFVKYFCSHFMTYSSIAAWDLGNETVHMPGLTPNPDTFYVWCSYIRDAIKSVDTSHPVISGLDDSDVSSSYVQLRTIGELCDIHTTHPYNIFSTPSEPIATQKSILDIVFRCRLAEDVSKVPVFAEEFGSIGYTVCSQKTEADFYRSAMYALFSHGCHGAMWWCAFDQGHFDYAPYRWNAIGSEYGFFKSNRREKPIVSVNRKFKDSISKIPGSKLPPMQKDGIILVQHDDRSLDKNVLRSAYILAKRANLDLAFSYVEDAIPDAPLYMLPSLSGNFSIDKSGLDELLNKVRNGAVLYLSINNALLRNLPQISGVDFSYREEICSIKNIKFNDVSLPVYSRYFLMPEGSTSEIIARDEDGNGVFFKNSYGKGMIYFLSLPLEKYLAESKGAFFKNSTYDYSVFYREAASCADVHRAADSDNPYIRLTEHIIDDNSLYIFAINYNNKPEKATILTDYKLSPVFGETISENEISLSENEAILLKAVKK